MTAKLPFRPPEPPFRMPARRLDSHKGDFGRALLVGGSRGMSGSIALSAMAALRCGAGLVTAAVPDRCLETVAGFDPCVMTVPLPDGGTGQFTTDAAATLSKRMKGVSAVGCGPGMTTGAGSVRIVERLLGNRSIPRVLDADAINVLATLRPPSRNGEYVKGNGSEKKTDAVSPGQLAWGKAVQREHQLDTAVLTPHPGELARLTGVPASDRDAQIRAAAAFAEQTGAVVVVKGGPTVVVGPHDSWTNVTGNPGMATAGAGDVLTGVITSLLAQALPVWDAACLGVWVHGLAGDLAAERYGEPGITAAEILESIPQAVAHIVAA